MKSGFQRRFGEILQQNQHFMAQIEVLDLHSDLRRLAETAKLLKPVRRTVQTGLNKTKAPRQRGQWPRENKNRGVFIDGVFCCKVCKRPIPHKAKAEWQFHMLAIKRRWMQAAAKVAWAKIGYEKLAQASVRSRRARSLQKRVAAFRELAPLAAAKLSDDEIMRLAAAYREPRGYMWSLQMWRVHVRRHYR